MDATALESDSEEEVSDVESTLTDEDDISMVETTATTQSEDRVPRACRARAP
jgi:hypothetical protein